MIENYKRFIAGTMIFLILFGSLLNIENIYNVKAVTQTPTAEIEEGLETPDIQENVESAEPVVTEPPNRIYSVGDFKLYGDYIDGTKAEENASINVSVLGEEAFTKEVIEAVRTQNAVQDMFVIFKLELQQNGRPMNQHTPLDLYVNIEAIFAEYEGFSLYKISDDGVAENIEISINEQHIMFRDDNLGKYVMCGDKKGILPTEKPMETTTPLQDGGTTGIIASPAPTEIKQDSEESVVTPGAFVFWLVAVLIIGLWIGLGIGYFLWGRYRRKNNNNHRGPFVIGE